MQHFSFFDQLRSYFEPILIYFFLVCTVAYAIYKLSFGKKINQETKLAIANLNASNVKVTRKDRKNLIASVIDQNLTNLWKHIVFFFADLFWILLVVVVLRSFIIEPFIIPSASMYPGLKISDVVAVNKSAYGVRVPLTDIVIGKKEVARGDVAVFKYPGNTKINYIKRIVGVPGDKIRYSRKKMIVNGQEIILTKKDTVIIDQGDRRGMSADIYEENLLGRKHLLQHIDQAPEEKLAEVTVPPGHYFAMGDNRDNSEDGRFWGFVPEDNLLGRAYAVILNFDCLKGKKTMCNRFFKHID